MMSPDEARDLFSEAYDEELDDELRAQFEAALEADEELRADYDDFVETFAIVGRLDEADPVPIPNLLPKIQDRLRRRSRGRYYRDRFSEKAGQFSWTVMLLAVVTVLMLVGATIYAMQTSVLDLSAPPTSSTPTETGEPSAGEGDAPVEPAPEPPSE